MSNTAKFVIDLVDKFVGRWIIYRAGQSSVINKAQEKLINDIKERNIIHDRVDNDPEYNKLLDKEFSRK